MIFYYGILLWYFSPRPGSNHFSQILKSSVNRTVLQVPLWPVNEGFSHALENVICAVVQRPLWASVCTSRGGRGGLPYERDENASWKTELYSKSYQLGRGWLHMTSMRPYWKDNQLRAIEIITFHIECSNGTFNTEERHLFVLFF